MDANQDRMTISPEDAEESFIAIEWDHLAELDAVVHSLNAIQVSQTAETMTEYSRWTPEERKYWGL